MERIRGEIEASPRISYKPKSFHPLISAESPMIQRLLLAKNVYLDAQPKLLLATMTIKLVSSLIIKISSIPVSLQTWL